MKVHEIMTGRPKCVAPTNTLIEAAGLMRELDVGALPVCDNEMLAGIVTDRDLVVRGIADGQDPEVATVSDVMSGGVEYAFADQEVEEVVRIMEQRQIRRLPVLDREKRLVGIVSLGDIATSSNPAFSGMALRDVSEPNEPTERHQRLQRESEPARMPKADGGRQRPEKSGRQRSASANRSRGRNEAKTRRASAGRDQRRSASSRRQSAAARKTGSKRSAKRSRKSARR